MNSLLYLRINLDQLLVQARMLPHHNLGVPRHRRKNRLNPRPHRRQKNLCNLQPNHKRKRHNHRRKVAVCVIPRIRKLEVQVCQQRADIRHAHASHRKHGAHEAVVNEGVDAAIAHHSPRILCSGDVGFAPEGDVAEGVAVEEGDEPVEEADAGS